MPSHGADRGPASRSSGADPGPGPSGTGILWWPMIAGISAGLVLVAVAELASLAFSASSAPFVAVGGVFIDVIPAWVKDVAIALFGTRDKDVLSISMLAVYVVLTALAGWIGARRPRAAAAVLAGLGIFATAMVLTRAGNTVADAIPTLLGTLVAVPTLLLLLRAVRAGRSSRAPSGTNDAGEMWASRRTLIGMVAVGVLAVMAGAAARSANVGREVARRAAQFVLPTPSRRAKEIPAGAQVDLEGMPPFVTPNDDFYRIDTALAVPRVDPTQWSLRIHGLVEREITLDFEELLAEPMVEKHVTLACVSNPIGGDLAGNATWLGVPVRTLLARAGVQDGADMVLSRSIDGFTASTPLEALTDARDSLVAVGMNGEPLPRVHGFPVRLVVPGLYGYVSATKWLTELKVTRFADDTAYWTPRGWSERGPIKIASRIDVPRSSSALTPDADGAVMLGGTAWAQRRGIAKVEVRIDDGGWREAELGAAVNDDTWAQWSLRWDDAERGNHLVSVRATDGNGVQQTGERANPAPNGATGWHTIQVTVQ